MLYKPSGLVEPGGMDSKPQLPANHQGERDLIVWRGQASPGDANRGQQLIFLPCEVAADT
jgi:hypothetical protein